MTLRAQFLKYLSLYMEVEAGNNSLVLFITRNYVTKIKGPKSFLLSDCKSELDWYNKKRSSSGRITPHMNLDNSKVVRYYSTHPSKNLKIFLQAMPVTRKDVLKSVKVIYVVPSGRLLRGC